MSRIGVVIPVYNGAGLIGQTLASIVAQSRPVDDVVVVDDGSTDDSLVEIKAWADRLPLTVIRQPANGGVSCARNAGVAALQTDVVALLDADDIWLPDHVELTLAAHERHGGIVSPAAFIWYPGGALQPYQKQLGLTTPSAPAQLNALLERNYVFVSSLFPRGAFDEVGGFRQPDMVEDWDFWVRLVASGLVVTQLDRATVLYRRHPGNATRNRSKVIPREIALLERFRNELPAAQTPAIERAIRHRRAELAITEHLDQCESAERPPLRDLFRGMSGTKRTALAAVALACAPRHARAASARH